MKLAFTLLFFSMLGMAQDHDFRDVNWGATQDEVLKAEGKKPDISDAVKIGFTDRLAGAKVAVFYEFADGKLFKGSYVLLESYSEPTRYLIEGAEWSKALDNKYGEGKPNVQWINPRYKNDTPDKQALAVSLGQMTVSREWNTKSTKIVQFISGNGGTVTLLLMYTATGLLLPPKPKDKF